MKIQANGIALEVEDSGGSGDAVLLIMGLGGQLIHWPASLVQALIDEGFRVISFDNRDSGLSAHHQGGRAPNIPWIATRAWLGLGSRVPYTLADMAADALGVLEVLGVHRAHVVGISMGAMIAQRVALAAPERVLSLSSVMGSSGARGIMKPKAAVMRAAASKPRDQSDIQALSRYYIRFFKAISSPTLAPSEAALLEAFERTERRHPPETAATSRQLAAILADTSRVHMLSRIQCPTLVMHGADDPFVPSACGVDTARRIPGARLEIIPDMAHDLVPAPHPEIVRRTLAVLIPFLRASLRS